MAVNVSPFEFLFLVTEKFQLSIFNPKMGYSLKIGKGSGLNHLNDLICFGSSVY